MFLATVLATFNLIRDPSSLHTIGYIYISGQCFFRQDSYEETHPACADFLKLKLFGH
jgi:hypothetical protein